MKFILCSDLHLKETEKEYCLSVLKEIIGLCCQHKCSALFFAGDVFDSRQSLKALRADFRTALELLPASCSVYFLTGNHEELRAQDSETLESYDFGRAKLLAAKPWTLHEITPDTELLAVPFQRDYSGYRDWEVPPKNKPFRILLAHGTVLGMSYTGPTEELDSVLDEDIFDFFKADLAALGHLHKQVIKKGKTIIAYPGSARVWREGEEGKRCVLLGNTETGISLQPLYLVSAGEYHVISVYASPEGDLRYELPAETTSHDWLHLELWGVVEDETSVLAAFEKIKTELEKKCRKISSSENLTVLAGISAHPLAGRFLRVWEDSKNQYNNEESGVYDLARLQGLLTLKDILEKIK